MRATTMVIAVLLLLGCIPAQAVRQAKENIALNRNHERNEALPNQARLVAQDNADAWEAQLHVLEPDYVVSPEARARQAERAAARGDTP